MGCARRECMVAPPLPEHNPVEACRRGVKPGSGTSPALYAEAMARPVPYGDGSPLKDEVTQGRCRRARVAPPSCRPRADQAKGGASLGAYDRRLSGLRTAGEPRLRDEPEGRAHVRGRHRQVIEDHAWPTSANPSSPHAPSAKAGRSTRDAPSETRSSLGSYPRRTRRCRSRACGVSRRRGRWR